MITLNNKMTSTNMWDEDIKNYPGTSVENFKYRNYDCELKRNVSGCWLGYVILKHPIPDEHIDNIEVHGGITYNDGSKIGFDCAHYDDIIPLLSTGVGTFLSFCNIIDTLVHDISTDQPTYKDRNFVIDQLKSVVDQLCTIELENID